MARRAAARSKPRSLRGDPTAGPRPREVRADGYVNAFSGHGTSRDRRTATRHKATVLRDLEALDLRRGNWLAGRICELKPSEAYRRGFEVKCEDKEQSEAIHTAIEELDIAGKLTEAGQMERTCGGAALFPVLDGAIGDLSTPLDLDQPAIAKVLAIHLLEPRELEPATWYEDITSPKFGTPATFRLWPLSGGRSTAAGAQLVHESRLVIFPGKRISREPFPGQRLGWGDNELSAVYEGLADFGLSWGSAAAILHKFGLDVWGIEGLAEILKEEGGEQLIQRYIRTQSMSVSAIGALAIDKKHSFERLSAPVSGLSDLLIQSAQLVAAIADTPLTILFGMSPAGMNATGESDIRGWYDRVGKLRTYYTPRVEQLVRLLLLSADGPTGGEEPESWSVEWPALWEPSEKERAETRKTVAETDKIYVDMGAASPDDVATSRWKGDTYSAEMTIDWAAREAQKKADEEHAEALDAAALEALQAGRQLGEPDPERPIELDDKPTAKPEPRR